MKEKWTLHKDEIEAIYCDSLTQNERNAVTSFKQYIAEEAKRGGYYRDSWADYPSNALKPKAPKPKPTSAPPVAIRPFWDRWDSWDVETKPYP